MKRSLSGRLLIASLLGLAAFLAAPLQAATVPGPGPQQLMEQVSHDLLRQLDVSREQLRKDPAGLRGLVDKYLLPHFDSDYAGRLVLGTHWREATPEQRQRFLDAFYKSMLAAYGDAILEFTEDRLTILPFRGDPQASSATVRTEVKRSNGTPVPVNYSLRATPEGWKVWDVTIEGISYIRNFRNDFGAEIDQKGLDAVIERLETQYDAMAGLPGTSAADGRRN